MGIALVIDNTLWSGAIVAFAVLAVVGLALSLSRHRNPWPLLMGVSGCAIITYTMFGSYSRTIEIFGFAVLCGASLWDWRLRRSLKC